MNAPSQDIKDILVADGIGTFGTDLFVSKQPSTPDAVVTVYDTGGFAPEGMTADHYPTVQMLIRGDQNSYRTTYTKAESVRDSLHRLHDETWNSTKYIAIWAMSDIIFVGYDENERPEFSINFRMHRRA